MPNLKSVPSSHNHQFKQLSWQPQVVSHIATLKPYPPGKPIEETKREFGVSDVIKLASNENPLGPSPRALEAIQKDLKNLHRYPDAAQHELKLALMKYWGLPADTITVGNGSNELIDILVRCFVQPQENIVCPQGAFVAYKLCAQLQGCGFYEAPWESLSTLRVPIDAFLKTVNEQTRLVVLANPNNPTGAFYSRDEITRLAQELDRRKILLVLDCAYWEYVTDDILPHPMDVFRQHPNVVLLFTFSKIYGLAGLRVGYAVADPKVNEILRRGRQPFNVSSLGFTGAVAALQDQDHVRLSQQVNQQGLALLQKGLKKLPVRVFPTQGNFFLMDVKQPADPLYQKFLQQGIIVRPVGNYGLTTHFRVSVGLPQENEKFLQVAKVLLQEEST